MVAKCSKKGIQIIMESEMHNQIKILAKRRNISTSKLVREVIKEKITKKKIPTVKTLLNASKNSLNGLPKDLSTNDQYLYAI